MIESINRDKCTGCGICADVCPLDTIRIDPIQKEQPPCQFACPAGVDMRAYIQYLKLGMESEAQKAIAMCLPFPSITGRLCHHPCISKCARKDIDEAVKINALERYLGDRILEDRTSMDQPVTHAARVAVIGSGPMGLSAAYFLQRMGYKVEVFESKSIYGGMLREEVNKGRLPGGTLERQIKYMKDLGINFRMKFSFISDDSFRELIEDGFRAVLLSTGFTTKDKLKMSKDILPPEKRLNTDPFIPQNGRKGLFVGGGIIMGRAPIAEIVSSAKKGATSINRFIQKEALRQDRVIQAKVTEQIPNKGIPIQKSNFDSSNVNKDAFFEESLRCMTCGGKAEISHPDDCMTCYCCELNCPTDAIYVHPIREELPASFNY